MPELHQPPRHLRRTGAALGHLAVPALICSWAVLIWTLYMVEDKNDDGCIV